MHSLSAADSAHNRLLKNETRVWQATAIVLWPVISATSIAYILASLTSLPVAPELLGSGVFVLLACGVPIAIGAAVVEFRGLHVVRVVASAVATFAGALVAMRFALPSLSSAAGVLFPAAVEEFTFRWFLPLALLQVFPNTRGRPAVGLAVVILSQCSFAASHALPLSVAAFPIQEALRLLTGGLLYAVIVDYFGLGAAIGVHAIMNFALERSWPNGGKINSLLLLGLVVVSLCLAARSVYARRTERIAFHPLLENT